MIVKCPSCNGQGIHFGFACPGFFPREYKCEVCSGGGSLSKKQYRDYLIGHKARELRISQKISLKEKAKSMGITPFQLSHMERTGRKP
jgi:hypothetical protein